MVTTPLDCAPVAFQHRPPERTVFFIPSKHKPCRNTLSSVALDTFKTTLQNLPGPNMRRFSSLLISFKSPSFKGYGRPSFSRSIHS